MNSQILSNIGVWILIIGTLGANIPQYIRLYRRKNTQGINEGMLIMGVLGCLSSLCGDMLENRDSLITYCSIENDSYECYIHIIGIIQLSCPYIIAYVFYIMFYYYSSSNDSQTKIRFIQTVLVNLLCCIGTIVCFFVCSSDFNHKLNIILNITSSIFSIVMWLPQIFETVKQKGNYSLSVPSIFIHSLGCMATVIYQSLFNNQNIFVIIPYTIAALLEFVLFCICVHFNNLKLTKKELYEPLSGNDKI